MIFFILFSLKFQYDQLSESVDKFGKELKKENAASLLERYVSVKEDGQGQCVASETKVKYGKEKKPRATFCHIFF